MPTNEQLYRYAGDPMFGGVPEAARRFDVGPLPPIPGLRSSGKPRGGAAGPLPLPSESEQARLDAETEGDSYLLQRLRALGLSAGDVDTVRPTWGRGFVAAGHTGNAAPVSSTTRFGTATFRPGTFIIGGEDPSRREFLAEKGARDAAASRRELSDFLTVNAPTGLRDNYGTVDPMAESSVRAGRAAALAREHALNPLPGVTVDDPMEVERAGGQAAYNAQKLAEARFAAQVSPVGQQATEQQALAQGRVAAAPGAMSIDAGPESRGAFLKWLFNLQEQGATEADIQQILALSPKGTTVEEVRQALAASSGGR